jgi:Ecdysteroid kinase-like family
MEKAGGITVLRPEHQQVLRDIFAKQNIVLLDHSAGEGCKPGDNYIGDIVRVTARIQGPNGPLQKNFIFKYPPGNKEFRDALKCYKFVKNEEAFYSLVVPSMNSFWQDAAKNKNNQLPTAQYYYSCSDDKNDVLVLEDLRERGFTMADRMNGLDFDHCLLVMQAFGKFHGTSMAMQEIQPENFHHTSHCIKETLYFDAGREQFSTIHFPCNAAIRMMESRYPERVDQVEKLKKLTNNYFDNLIEMVETPSPLAVINHGDSWVNNILFRYQNGKPVDLRFIDFQLARFGSLALDLSYLLYNSCTKSILDAHWDVFMNTYMEELNSTLESMGASKSKITRHQLDEEMKRFGRFGIAGALQAIPFFVTPIEDQPKMEGGLEVFDNFHNNSHKNLVIRDRLTDMIVHAIEKGIL